MRTIAPLRVHPVKSARNVWCCRMSQLESGIGLPHVWYEDSGIIYKWYYCPLHEPETRKDTFKTKRELLAHRVTRKLLNEEEDLPPF